MQPAAAAYNQAHDLKYEQLSHEIRSIKVQLATMNDVAKKEQLFEKVVNRRPLIQAATEMRISEQPVQLDYSVSEMLTQVEFDLPV